MFTSFLLINFSDIYRLRQDEINSWKHVRNKSLGGLTHSTMPKDNSRMFRQPLVVFNMFIRFGNRWPIFHCNAHEVYVTFKLAVSRRSSLVYLNRFFPLHFSGSLMLKLVRKVAWDYKTTVDFIRFSIFYLLNSDLHGQSTKQNSRQNNHDNYSCILLGLKYRVCFSPFVSVSQIYLRSWLKFIQGLELGNVL